MLQLLGRKPIGRTRCPDARALLASYVEGELDTVDRERVAGHLQFCSSCQVEERKFRDALTALAAAEPIPAPRDLYAGFAARLEATHGPFRRRTLRLRLAGAAACLLLVTAAVATPYLQQILTAEPEEFVLKPLRVTERNKPKNATPVKQPEKMVNLIPDSTPDDSEADIIQPDPFDPEPVQVAGDSRKPKNPAVIVENFLDVKPEKGLSVSERMRLRTKSVAGMKPLGPDALPRIPRLSGNRAPDSGFIQERDERIEIGDSVTTVRTGYKVDNEGRRAVVNVDIGTTVSN